MATKLWLWSVLGVAALACVEPLPASESTDTDGSTGWGWTDEGPEPEPSVCELLEDCPDPAVCVDGWCHDLGRRPYLDGWREELVLPADGFDRLVVGGVEASHNYANRGDIEVRALEGVDILVVEFRRVTYARDLESATQAFARMQAWVSTQALADPPGPPGDALGCELGQTRSCHVRSHYDGQLQPVRDGVHIRVTVPLGWPGALELETEDSLAETGYPVRSDVRIDGHAGSLKVAVGSGRVDVRLADEFPHYPGCAAEAACVASEFAPGCGCETFASIDLRARPGEAADITIDVPASLTSTAVLHNFAEPWGGCEVEIDCAGFDACTLDPATAGAPATERAALNHPGDPAPAALGVGITLVSADCREVEVAESFDALVHGPSDARRGDLRLCSSCLGAD